MGRTAKPRRKYRPRPVVADTLTLALHKAAKPNREDREQVLAILREASEGTFAGHGSEFHWSILAGGLNVAKAIERQGIVRGLADHFAGVERVLQAVYDRAMATGAWRPPTLSVLERDAVQQLVELHEFQVNQLGRAELLKALDEATRDIRSEGNTFTMLDGRTITAAARETTA